VCSENVELVRCAAVEDVMSAGVVVELFKLEAVVFVEGSSKLVLGGRASGDGEPG